MWQLLQNALIIKKWDIANVCPCQNEKKVIGFFRRNLENQLEYIFKKTIQDRYMKGKINETLVIMTG